MEQNNLSNHFDKGNNSRILSGLILLAAGILLFAYKMGAPIPGWLFTWPVILILIGIISGIKSNFNNPGSYMMIAIGTIFLLDQNVEGIDFHQYLIPLILISIGLLFIIKPKGHCKGRRKFSRWNERNNLVEPENYSAENPGASQNELPEYLNINAVFGGVKKKIFSKNFQGGEIVCFMGGAEINLTQADMKQPIHLEVNNVFGGTKIVIPSNWDIKNQISAVFGGVEDKRLYNNIIPDANKVIMLKGSCIFGGIEITNY